jgi:protein-S-isoprenylcysteine O-methyltransferase Ste14
MQTDLHFSKPVLELKGLAGRIDLSAWLSGLSFGAGLWFCKSPVMAAEILGLGIGFHVLAAAFSLFLAAVLLIQRHMRLSLLANTFGAPRQLVTSGIFRYSRNPIYVAFFVPLASIAYFSLSASIAATGIYILAMNLTVIRKEEGDLHAAFGSTYEAYSNTVPRWII